MMNILKDFVKRWKLHNRTKLYRIVFRDTVYVIITYIYVYIYIYIYIYIIDIFGSRTGRYSYFF